MNGYSKGKAPRIGGRRQQGITLIGLLVVGLVVGLALVIGMRLTPVYLESMEVDGILSNMESDHELQGASEREIRQALRRYFQVNGINRIERENISFSSTAGGTLVVVDYEARVPLIWNLDAVAQFRKEAVIRQ